MKRALIVCACAVTLATACSTAPKTEDVEVTEDSAVSMLDVHEMTFTDPTGSAFMKIAADGAITVLDEKFALGPGHHTTITPDGAVTRDDGELLLQLQADGTLTKADGSTYDVTITEDGTSRKEGRAEALVFDEDGNMGAKNEVGVVTHTNGEDGPRARRALALAFIGTMFHAELAMKQMAEDVEPME